MEIAINRVEIIGENLTTSASAKPNVANLVITNGRQKDIRIFYITLVPDSAFKTLGNVFIDVEGHSDILQFSAGTLKRASELVLKMTEEGALFPNNTRIKVFIWGNGTPIELSVFITIGEFD